MARSVPWRRSASDAASWHQDQSQNAIIYILREMGPTGFLLKEEGETKKYKVFLGDPHSCTCPVFSKEKDLCKHICWVLIKKFRLPRDNPLSFQLGLVEREINELLRGIAKKEQKPSRRAQELAKKAAGQMDHNATGDGREVLQQKEITGDDVCPICQDELLEKREPVTYCRYGCGKSTHIRCMKVWAEHQKSTGEVVIRCPLCREDYGQIEDLQAEYRTATLQKTRQERRDDIHMGVVCKGCNQSPITGKCYRCSQCFDFSLCHNCFADKVHEEHSFQFRQKPTQRWRPAQRGSGAALPQAVLEDLLNRDLSEEDYDLLLQLDNEAANKPSNIPEHVIKSFPVETIRQGSAMLTPGTQCRVCLRGYEMGQVVRRLPCRHKYHVSCIDQWLTHEHPTCPVDGTVVWNPLTAEVKPKRKKRPQSLDRQNASNQGPVLEIPGVGVAVRHGSLERVGGRRGRQVVERVPDGHPGLDPLFALSGSAISSNASGSQSRPNLSGHGEERQNIKSGQKSTVRLGKTTHHRTSSPAGSLDNLAVTGAGHLGNSREDQSRDRTAMASQSRSKQGNQHYSPLPHHRTHYNRDRHDSINGNINRNEGAMSSLNHQMHGLSIGSSPVVPSPGRSPAFAGPGWRPPPATLANEQSHISSIPLPREAIMTPIGNQHPSSPSAVGRPPRPNGRGAGMDRDRGRRNSRSEASRGGSRSSSASGRAGSRDRLQRGSPSKLETLENMFLGSPTGNLAISERTAPGSPHNKGHRSNQPRLRTKPYHTSSSDGVSNGREDIALTGNRVTGPDG